MQYKNIPIFLASDDNYAPFIATTIVSVCDNTESFIDFYVLDGGITQENKEKICSLSEKFKNFSLEFIEINMNKVSSTFEEWSFYRHNKGDESHITLSAYNRLFIPIKKPEISKLVYLDVDVIVLGDIKEFFNEDLQEYSLGAVPDNELCDFVKNRMETLDLYGHEYFNSGVLLINNEKWVSEKILEKFLEIYHKYKNRMLSYDQDILNIFFRNNYKIMDYKYNWYPRTNHKLKDKFIVHYCTDMKPWNLKGHDIGLFWKYAKMTPFYKELIRKYAKQK